MKRIPIYMFVSVQYLRSLIEIEKIMQNIIVINL